MTPTSFPYFDGTFVRTAPDNADGSHNIAGFIFRFPGHGSFDPTGKVEGPTPEQEQEHNRNLDRAQLDAYAQKGRGIFYLTKQDGEHTVTTWAGTWKRRALHVSKGRHNIARTQYTVTFTGPDGKPWTGRQYGENTQILRARRMK